MRLLFIMDPFETMHPDKDTTYAFMRAAIGAGHEVFHTLVHGLSNEGRTLSATTRQLQLVDEAPHVTATAAKDRLVTYFDAVFIRKDPPFDAAYLHLTQQLELVRDQTLILNDPRALRDANEKLFAFQFAEFMPGTLVSASTQAHLEFLRKHGGKGVVKPLDGAGGAGVMGVDAFDRNSRGITDYVTREGTQLALSQVFQEAVVEGDKRVLLLDGTLLGAIRRVPQRDDIRANIHVGGRVEACDLTEKENELVRKVGPALAESGLFFVGLDLIAERLIEVNVTSPTGIQELGRLTKTTPEATVIQWVEDRVKQAQS